MNQSAFPGKYAFHLEYPLGHSIISENLEIEMRSASLIKLPILLYAFQIAKDLDERIEITTADLVEGAGILQTLVVGKKKFTIRELITLMIVVSDNTATNVLIHRYGMPNLNEFIQSIGMTSTKLARLMRDEVAILEGRENTTTATDITKCLKSMEESISFKEMLHILKGQQFQHKVPFGVADDEFTFYHKTGELDGLDHDSGFFYFQDKLGLFVGLTEIHEQNGLDALHRFGEKIRSLKGERT
ncbi:MAG: serine hydrolase [Paenisporosarcina sp.]